MGETLIVLIICAVALGVGARTVWRSFHGASRGCYCSSKDSCAAALKTQQRSGARIGCPAEYGEQGPMRLKTPRDAENGTKEG